VERRSAAIRAPLLPQVSDIERSEMSSPIKCEWPMSLAVSGLLACALPCAAQLYTLADLGALPGNSVSAAYALNNLGGVAGASSTQTADIATLFSDGIATSISTLGASVSLATAINSSGEMVGYNIFYSEPNSEFHAFLYSGCRMKDINSATLFPSGSEAWGLTIPGRWSGPGI
jgi:probable HAF family extracellular repeat protein